MIVISGYDEINFSNASWDFAVRYVNFRLLHHFNDCGLARQYPDQKWQLLRKVVQKHLKRSNESMKADTIVSESYRDMFLDFGKAADSKAALDPLTTIKRSNIKAVASALCGARLRGDHDPLIDSMLQYETTVIEAFGGTRFDDILLDLFPAALLHLPLGSVQRLKSADEARNRLANELKRVGLQCKGSLGELLHEHLPNEVSGSEAFLTEDDIIFTLINLLLAEALAIDVTLSHCTA